MLFGSNPREVGGVRAPNQLAIMQALNLYVYVVNNPIRYIDPWGLVAVDLLEYVETFPDLTVNWSDCGGFVEVTSANDWRLVTIRINEQTLIDGRVTIQDYWLVDAFGIGDERLVVHVDSFTGNVSVRANFNISGAAADDFVTTGSESRTEEIDGVLTIFLGDPFHTYDITYRQAFLQGVANDWSTETTNVHTGQHADGFEVTISRDAGRAHAWAGGPIRMFAKNMHGYRHTLADFMSVSAHEFGHAGFRIGDIYHETLDDGTIRWHDPLIATPFPSIMNDHRAVSGAQPVDWAIILNNRTWERNTIFRFSNDPATLDRHIGYGLWSR